MQHLGLFAILLYWVTVSLILYRFGIDSKKTISDHVATGRQRKLYTPLALIYFFLINLHLILWLLPHYDAKAYQYGILAFGMTFLLLTFLVPRHGAHIKKHDFFASIVGVSLLVLISSIIFGIVSAGWAWLYAGVLTTLLVAGSTLMKRDRRGYLQTQVFFFAMLNIFILLLTYV